ncbi:hypothetical protein [Blautia wexlerae]
MFCSCCHNSIFGVDCRHIIILF